MKNIVKFGCYSREYDAKNRKQIEESLRKFAKSHELEFVKSRFNSLYLIDISGYYIRVSDHMVKNPEHPGYLRCCIEDIPLCPSYDPAYDLTADQVTKIIEEV